MLASDLTLNSADAITAGTSNSAIYSLLGSNSTTASVRSVAAVATTNPKTFKIANSVRVEKGFKTVANQSVPAPDITFDRRLCRLDHNVVQTTHLDPNKRINASLQVLWETPRLGAESPTVQSLIDMLLALTAMLRASSNANAVRLFNGEL